MVRVDQTVLTAAILNFAINPRNAMPNGGTHETRRLGKHEGGRKRWRKSGRGAALVMLIVSALCSRPLLTLTLSHCAKSASRRGTRPITYLDKL
jgi:hypothetical protein